MTDSLPHKPESRSTAARWAEWLLVGLEALLLGCLVARHWHPGFLKGPLLPSLALGLAPVPSLSERNTSPLGVTTGPASLAEAVATASAAQERLASAREAVRAVAKSTFFINSLRVG